MICSARVNSQVGMQASLEVSLQQRTGCVIDGSALGWRELVSASKYHQERPLHHLLGYRL